MITVEKVNSTTRGLRYNGCLLGLVHTKDGKQWLCVRGLPDDLDVTNLDDEALLAAFSERLKLATRAALS